MDSSQKSSEPSFELKEVERAALIACLAGQRINRQERFSSSLYTMRRMRLRFEDEALGMKGNLSVVLRERVQSGIEFVEYVWSFKSDDGATALLDVWPFVRGIKLDPGYVRDGKVRYARLRADSTNPKLLLEDLGDTSYLIERREDAGDISNDVYHWNYQLNWELMDGCALQVDVPFAQLFLAEGIERVEVITDKVLIPACEPSHTARRGRIRYVARPPWNRIMHQHDLVTLDACIYVQHQHRWVYRPAEIRDPSGVIPDGWYQQLREIVRPRLRTVLRLRAEYIKTYVERVNDELSFAGEEERVDVHHRGGDGKYHEYLDTLMSAPLKRFRARLDKLRNSRELWRLERELLTRMLESLIEGLDLPRDRAIYGSFDPTRETDETRAEFEAAKQELLQAVAYITAVISKISALLQRHVDHKAFVSQLLIERHDQEELRRQFKSRRAQLGSKIP